MDWEDKEIIEEIKKLENSNMTIKDKCKYLGISRYKFKTYSNKKGKVVSKSFMSRCDQRYVRIDNYANHEIYRGIIIETITRISNADELFETKKLSNIKLTQRNVKSMIDLQDIKKTIDRDREKINLKIKNISSDDMDKVSVDVYKEKLGKSLMAIGYIKRLVDSSNSSLVSNILNGQQTTYLDLGIMADSYEFKKDFIDMLIVDIELSFSYKTKEESKEMSKLIKYYLLKYMQTPLPYFSMDYSNSLLCEYNFQKVLLEIDMSIPFEDQMDTLKDVIVELYGHKQLSSYSVFIRQNLIEEFEECNLGKIMHGQVGNNKYDGVYSKRVADMFYIYDMVKNGYTYRKCIDKLQAYYLDQGVPASDSSLSTETISKFYKLILNFINEFKKEYGLFPSSLSKEKSDYKEQRKKAQQLAKNNYR